MVQQNFNVVSKNENLRLCIIENTIFIEESISAFIGDILDIDWKSSKSFGFSSTSLSFNQKVQIIQDIKGVDKEVIKKFTYLTNIRNKFAHVSRVATFEDLFSSSKNGKEIKKSLEKWYAERFDNNSEDFYRLCFYSLIEDIIEFIFTAHKKHMYDKGYEVGYSRIQELYSKSLIKELSKTPNGRRIFETVSKKIHETTNKNIKSV